MPEISKVDARELIQQTFNAFSGFLERNEHKLRGRRFDNVSFFLSNFTDWRRIVGRTDIMNDLFRNLDAESYNYLLQQCYELADLYRLSTRDRLVGARVGEEVRGAPIWLIHGAFNSIPVAGNHWGDDTAGVRAHIKKLFGHEYYEPEWNGRPTVSSIRRGAQNIARQIKSWKEVNPGKPLILIGYSHGGNVNKEIVNILARNNPPIFVNTVINFGTPIRPEFSVNASVGQHINVYNTGDAIQVFGAGRHQLTDPESGMPLGIRAFPRDPRRYGEPENNVTVTPRYHPLRGFRNHEFMHTTIEVWKDYIQPILILP